MRGDNSIALVRRRKFRLLNKNVARKENQEECVAPTTARSPGRPPGCALMVASEYVCNQSQKAVKSEE